MIGGHLGMPNCKESKWLHARIIVTQSWYNIIEIFFISHIAIFKKKTILILKQLNARIILVAIDSVVMFFAIFETADGGHLGFPNCNKSKWLHAKIILNRNLYISIEIFYISHFAIFIKGSHLD